MKLELSFMDEKTSKITAETRPPSNQVLHDGETGINIELNVADDEFKSSGKDGIAGEGGLGDEMAGVEMLPTKRKRGRPRKYEVGGEILARAVSPPLSYTPSHSHSQSSLKRCRGRPRGSGRLQLLAASGGVALDTAGGSFTPHVVNVAMGEDIVNRISSFSQKGPRAICILSATGAVSHVIIHQPGSKSGNILRYDGLFEILSLSGSYIGEMNGCHRKKGMLSVSLAKPDGRVFGGAVASSLIAASPVQLVVASFKQNISNAIKKWQMGALSQPVKHLQILESAGVGEATNAPFIPHPTKHLF